MTDDTQKAQSSIVIFRARLVDQPRWRRWPESQPNPIQPRSAERYSDSHFLSPALHVAFARIVNLEPRPGEADSYRVNITHTFTPESQHSIHYWWFVSRNFRLESDEVDTFMRDNHKKAYKEDVDALEWIMDVVLHDNEGAFELNFAPDKPGLLMRRNIYNFAKAEQRG